MKLLSGLLVFFLCSSSYARWVQPPEAASRINFERWRYRVNKDGTYALTVERQLEILKDNARTDQGLTRLTFDSRSSDFELLEAKTINPDGDHEVRKEHIEVKPLASAGPGFDEHRQITIAYPRVEVGSKLFYRYRRDIKKTGVRGLFSETFSFGWNELVEQGELAFESDIPLYHELVDPNGALEVKSGRKGGQYTLSVRLKKPVFHQIVQEQRTQMSPESLPWVAVSSAPDWKSLPPETPGFYEKVIHSDLPAAFLPLLEKAKAKKDPYDQIDAITSGLRELVRYVGDWQQIEGAFHPRPLALVAETGFGDCKDFTSVTAAVLQRLGFEAHAAWVGRGTDFVPAPTQKVAAYYFNHAIVHAVKDGKTYWVDPTNEQSFSRGIFPDIADRPALVLQPGAFRLDRVPAMDPEGSLSEIEVSMKIGKNGEVDSQGKIALKGASALSMTAQGLFLSKSQLDYSFLSWIRDPGTLRNWKFSDYDLKSRIVKDIHLDFTFDEIWYPVKTTAGEGYEFPENSYLDLFQIRQAERVGDLVLDRPNRWKRTFRLKGKKFNMRAPLSCSGKSRWIDFSRSIALSGGTVVAKEEVTLKVSRVPVEEIRTEEFRKITDKMFRCLQRSVAVY